MGSRAIAISTLVLRIFTLLALVACVVLFITNTFRDAVFDDGSKVTFKDLTTYRFVLSTAVIGATYTLLQLPFALYYALTEKRLIKVDILRELDLYGDKIIAFLLASGVGAGFAVSVEIKSLLNDLFDAFAIAGFQDTEDSKALYDKFLNKGIIATSALAFGFVCMALVSVLSSVNRSKTATKGFFG
ncbi:CASP-like protein 4D1 [Populus nigra]|uniref:CASP-like protein 4D1 n=1 Tax=Populus nigra TaxID=3691 RepID=UPI002B267030|nr:CASP-like protein 4D1 [Populus nigra]